MTRPMKFLSLGVALANGMACSTAAAADRANAVKLAAARYDTHSATSGIVGTGVPFGADVNTGDANTVVVAYERMLGPNLGVEFAVGVPPRIRANATGSITALGDDVLSAKAVAPTVLLSYHFGDADARLRPYIGAGVNYTRFTGVRSQLGDVRLSDSTGLALQLGLHYAITKEWGAFASVVRIDAKTKLTTTGVPGLSTTIDLKPRVYSAGITYSF